jgi:hypothetical protein
VSDDEKTVLSTINDLGGRLIGSMPPAFLMLCTINLIFILGLLWFMDRREQQRERLLGPYLTACEHQVPLDALRELLGHFKRND